MAIKKQQKKERLKMIWQKIVEKKYLLLTIVILSVTFFLRFYHFDQRWALGNDDSRDASIGLEALRRHEFPLTGSFSSAGPFVFGPFFYWFIMGSYLLLPFITTAPWLFTAFIGVATVCILMYCGKKIAGAPFALLVGLLAALSPQLVSRSVVMGQHTFVSFFTSCTILFILLFLEKKKLIYSFLIGIAIGTTINFHYQGINLLVFLPALFFVPGINFRIRTFAFLLACLGVLLGLSPLLFWDSQQQFANFRNLFDYLLIGQYRLYVPNSWKLFLFHFLPSYWSFVVGGNSVIALITMIVSGITFVFAFIKSKISQNLLFLIIPFGLLLLLNRFYKGERSEGYLLYFLPFILIFTAYTFFILLQTTSFRFSFVRKIVASILLIVIIIGNSNALSIVLSYKNTYSLINKTIDALVVKYPHKKFIVYDYKGSLSYYNQPLGFLLGRRHLTDKNGIAIGILCYNLCPNKYPQIASLGGVFLADLHTEKNISHSNPTWIAVNPENMYDDLIGWSWQHKLKSQFSLSTYLTDKLHF